MHSVPDAASPDDSPKLPARGARARQEISDSQQAALRDRAVFEAIPVAVFTCDRSGVVQSYNRRAAELWGREPRCGDPNERYCGSSKLYLPDGTFLPHADSPMVEVLRTGVPAKNVEVLIEHLDGSRVPVIVNFAALKNPQGEIIGAITTFDDITALKRAHAAVAESEARFHAIADNIPQLAWIADAEGTVDWFNRGWLEYTGTTLEQNVGAGWKAVHHPDHVEAVAEKFERHLREGKPWEDTFPLRGKDGGYRWFLSRMQVIRDPAGKIVRYFGTNTDISGQRAAEDALKQADRRKNEFLAMLAHELRNPLAPIHTASEILRHEAGHPEAVRSVAEMLERQVSQMVRLVEDLLDISRVNRGKIELRKQRVALADAVNQAVETIGPQCKDKQHHLSVTLPPQPVWLNADPARLTQMLSNLLTNACKFTEPGGRIALTVETEGATAVIRVRDSGIGIAADQLPNIFEMFTQVDTSLARRQSGLGIGLTLVKHLVEAHDGSIQPFSAGLGQGSEFVVRLPVLVTG